MGNLELLLGDSGGDYSDAEILVENIPIGVHRCILSSAIQTIIFCRFTSSSLVSNGSFCHKKIPAAGPETGSSLEIISLSKLSNNLEQLLGDSGGDYSDAEILVENIPVGVHRCILAARSRFFHELFEKKKGILQKEEKPKYNMNDLLPYGRVGYESFQIFLSYLYTGKLRPFPSAVSTCVDNLCAHDACRPAIEFTAELMYASSIFQVPELASLFQRRLLNFVDKALVEDVIPILLVAHHCESSQLVTSCVDRVARSNLDSITLEKELPFEVAENIKLLRPPAPVDDENDLQVVDPVREKRIKRILRALDSDDIELVNLLLSESGITLDEANALHYAAAYCDPKVVKEVLAMGGTDLNLRNARGYTVLHIAAMRREPSIIVALLNKGACPSETTLDGRTAVRICQRLTRPKDYDEKTEQGQETNEYRICIDVLEREMWRNPMTGNVSASSPIMTDDLHMSLLYLENRVAFARLFFPTEAKLAMEIASAETSEFAEILTSRGSNGNLREVDLNETPIMQKKRLLSRIKILSKTVEMGRRYFPRCSKALDKFMEDDLPDLLYLEKGTPEEQRMKKQRFVELKEDVQRAFDKDKAERTRSGLSSSSSSPFKHAVNHKVRKL
ncbi:BTB/POZ domain and ankyrin repeat-containing protein NPR1 isoform X2 [Diospyros lotus]|uniref:BTB/POZ domain and ankyrin repeat-containing protein NPR1 isoform X2 n=1 Tax=Diospyros lotus TaxID=55363 RepID=UPI00224D3AC0|nr:BTB/POZ domain and ankyrin repeat-containing protein NPR1 isoform X2 [Diospyros lotus]